MFAILENAYNEMRKRGGYVRKLSVLEVFVEAYNKFIIAKHANRETREKYEFHFS